MVIPGESPARKLIEAFRVAADAIDRQARSNAFEFRLIEAPAFNVDAVWLHGDGDWFAVVHVPGPSINGDLVSADRFVDIFNHVQSLKRRKRVDLDYEREPEIVASVSPRALESR
jgi:hypothetical protein